MLKLASIFVVAAFQSVSLTRVPPGTGSIEGIVFGISTDHRIPDAKVTVSPFENGDARIITFTGAEGRYLIEGLAAGDYRVRVEREGFVSFPAPGDWQEFVSSNGIRVARVADGRRATFNVRLHQGGAIRGRVTDETGTPVEGERIALTISSSSASGSFEVATTDALGEFVADRVLPGSYYIRAQGKTGVIHGFYPGVLDTQDAALVRIGPGERVTEINFAYPGRLRGTLSYEGSANAVVRLLGSSKPGMIRTPTISPDREFVFSPVPPGRYVLTAVVRGESTLAAWQAVDISPQPAPIPLVLNPTATLRGRVVVEGVTTALNAVSIGAALLDGTTDVDALLQNSAEVDATGRFELTALFGERRLRLLNQPTNCALKSIRKTGRPIESLSFSGGEVVEDLEVVLSCY